MDYNEKKQKIIDYIKKGEKPKESFKVGVEMEHFIVDFDTLETVTYFGEKSVKELMEYLKEKHNYKAHEENGYILSLSKDGIDIATEPAAQFEIAIEREKNINDLSKKYLKVIDEVLEFTEKKNEKIVCLGYHPKTKIDDIKILPKDRYKYMYEYFKTNGGKYAHNMMKGTASTQIAIDFCDEKDFSKKYFVANAISPILYTIFDNSYIFEGEVYDKRNLRQEIWNNCDRQRTGVYAFSFDKDLSYEKYAEKILDTDIIFINENGEDIYKGKTKFVDIMDDNSSDEMIFHALSIVFPDVRLKKYIEIRMPDEVLYPLNFSAAALVKGLFYDEENLDNCYKMFNDMTIYSLENLKSRTNRYGLFAKYKDKTIKDIALELMQMAKKGLLEDEIQYIDKLEELTKNNKTPRDVFERLYKVDKKRAIDEFSLKR